MLSRPVGASGLEVSRVGLGTMTWGEDTSPAEAAEQLRVFVDAGGTLVETADDYGGGAAQQVLGGLLRRTVPRDDLVIAGRGSTAGTAGPGGRASRATLLRSLDTTLRRLGVDHLDLWQFPGWDPHVPLDEMLSAVQVAVYSGRVRYTGLVAPQGWQLATVAGAAAGGPDPAVCRPVSTQVEYSLLAREPEAELLPAARHHGLGILAWAPLGRGVLTGKYTDGTPADSRGASTLLASYVEARRTEHSARIVQSVLTAADGLGTSPLVVALTWVRDRTGVASAVVGARDAAQLLASLAAEDVTLPAEIRTALDDVSDPVR
ncbi:aldo/keto reductase [Pseudonocardia sp. EC080610-09]|uniref:aldo/keto reductase n=1 Tax=unclassified Pseudonocardia TaxID=2619320 RepID=UPI0006CB7AAB|nr:MULTISPECIES: aldo/keto reductase [unclassified Pseudonocardia]ALE74629.1 aldo/keto reductase [Pseudonocardia sp. EC080625-04]ALL78056.1 aldo/keto reductase [Pseudonocardia sp. EC080610-09]ALL80967.1 aldo/keto reductase [Pseudonocardia sp. EC080619-01]